MTTARDLLQQGINEAGDCGWSDLIAAPSIVALLRRADATPPPSSDVVMLRDALASGWTVTTYEQALMTADLDALIAAVRADATRGWHRNDECHLHMGTSLTTKEDER